MAIPTVEKVVSNATDELIAAAEGLAESLEIAVKKILAPLPTKLPAIPILKVPKIEAPEGLDKITPEAFIMWALSFLVGTMSLLKTIPLISSAIPDLPTELTDGSITGEKLAIEAVGKYDPAPEQAKMFGLNDTQMNAYIDAVNLEYEV